MQKIGFKAFILFVTLIILTGCSVTKKKEEVLSYTPIPEIQTEPGLYPIYVSDTALTDCGVIQYEVDLYLYPSTWEDSQAPATKEIVFRDKSYTLNYKCTDKNRYNTRENQVYFYENSDTGDNLTFSFDKQTQKLVYASAMGINKLASFPVSEKTEEAYRAIAEKFLRNYSDEIDDYRALDIYSIVTINYPDGIDTNGYDYFYTRQSPAEKITYKFRYVRDINGIPTEEGACIEIDENGNVLMFSCSPYNFYENAVIPVIDETICQNTIESKLEKIYIEPDSHLISYEVQNKSYLHLNDERIGLKYRVAATVQKNLEYTNEPTIVTHLIDLVVLPE